MSEQVPLTKEYFEAKRRQDRKSVADTGSKGFEAVEIATRVLRLHFPSRHVRAVRTYFNNEPMPPFVKANQSPLAGKLGGPVRMHIVVDVYFFFGGQFGSDGEQDAFVVEVAFPIEAQRAQWQCIARVRWADLNWERMGSHAGDVPVPHLIGETFINDWL